MSNDNTWNKLYDDYIKAGFRSWEEYFSTKMKLKRPFLEMIHKYANKERPILECGAGTGKFAAYLASLGFKSYAMDLETAMVEQARALSEKISPMNPVNVYQGDIREIPFEKKFFSLTHSSGVLEHYSNDEIIEIINEQLRVADFMVFSVPSPYFEKKMLGNERFMSRNEWRNIIKMSNATIIEETGYHYKPVLKRLCDIFKKPTCICKPIALFTFVLKEK